MLEANAECEIVGVVADGRALVAYRAQLDSGLKLIALTMHADERFVRAAF